MKRNSQFVMKQNTAMVQWHRIYQPVKNKSLWTQNLLKNLVAKFSVTN